MTRHPFALAACAAALALQALPAQAAETYVSYDAYAGPRLANDRWLGAQLERQRAVRAGVLRMTQRDFGLQTDNVSWVEPQFRTEFRNPAAVTQIRANVVVNQTEVSDCAANTFEEAGGVGAAVGGTYFNLGTPVAGSALGDVRAFMYVARPTDSTQPANVLQVGAVVAQCLDAACLVTGNVAPELDFGTVTLGTNVRLQVEWDAPNNQFIFRRDALPAQTASYTVADGLPASLPWKALFTNIRLQHCISGPRTEGYVDASFDTVSVNTSAAP